ncbi:unnamed protein product [Caenorhabditis auriculariae]|uniref:Uncharacterized protein n=1 Tax=Caenorhabditis auriculariae TaxID=2777116 RepID=A0A8S1H1H4_9PELO|nr:unnamed protein product [Caenorhabditis auriculariae]
MRFLCFFVVASLVFHAQGENGCKDLQGQNVDWFIVYKLPQIAKTWESGNEYAYLDANNINWTLQTDINDPNRGVGLTIKQIYKSDKFYWIEKTIEKDDFHIMYSDDDPVGKAESYRGHAKGIALFDSSSGFWIIHSVPNFPPSKSYSYPSTAKKYGQTIMCLSFNVASLSDIAEQWRFMQVTPYSSNLPDKFANRNVISKQSLSKSAAEFKSLKRLVTRDGTTIFSCAKHKKFNGDVWNDIISQEMGVTLAVESWLNGSGDDLHSTCAARSQTHDVREVKVLGQKFKSSKDHSKWGVADKAIKPLVCIAETVEREKKLIYKSLAPL